MTWDGQERRHLPVAYQQEVLQRLTGIEFEIKGMRQELEDDRRLLRGNGREGLVVRHDRVEQFTKALIWAMGIVYVAVVGLLVGRFRP